MTWKKTQFRRSIHENAIAKGMDPMIAAYVSDKAPGLAIHRHSADSKSGWKVSHIPTGKATGFDALNLTAAKALAEHMTTWFDWSQDSAGIMASFEKGNRNYMLAVRQAFGYNDDATIAIGRARYSAGMDGAPVNAMAMATGHR